MSQIKNENRIPQTRRWSCQEGYWALAAEDLYGQWSCYCPIATKGKNHRGLKYILNAYRHVHAHACTHKHKEHCLLYHIFKNKI